MTSSAESSTVTPRRAGLRALGVLALGLFAANCGLDKLTSNESAASAVTFRLAGDSVVSVGVSRPFTITPSQTVDLAQVSLSLEATDTTLVRVDSLRGQTAWITGRRNGTGRVRLTARAPELPGGRSDSANVRVRFGAIRIDPIDTIAGLGAVNSANQRTVVVRGTRPDGSPAVGTPTVTATVVSRDTARLRPVTVGSSILVARDTGLVWVVATFDGATDSVRVPIRRRIARVVADSFAFGALFTSRSVPLRVLDAGDSVIVGAPYRVSGIDTLRLQIDSTSPGTSPTAPRLRARVRDTSSFIGASGTVVSPRTRTRVVQVPANIVLGAGGGQSVRFSTAVPVAPRIIVRDSGGQGIQGVAVTFSVPSVGSGTVTGAAQTTNAAGEATVGGWTLGPNSGTDSLVATVAGLPAFVVTATAQAGAPARVRFLTQPQGGGSGVRVTPAPQVAVVDSAGNTVLTAADSISVVGLPVSGNGTGGTLTGALRVAAATGVATFDSLTFSDTTSGIRLIATRAGLPPDTSAAFPIGRPATQLLFTVNPVNTRGGVRMASVTLEFRDAANRRASGTTDTVTLAIDNTPSVTLRGTVRRAAVAGVVTFDDLSVMGGAFQNPQLRATTSRGLTALSGGFTVQLGPPSQLQFEAPPASVAPNVTQSIAVSVVDSGGNRVSSANPAIVLRVGTNPGSATLSDTLRVASNGTAFFSPAVSAAGTGYTLLAVSTGLATATSVPFNVRTPGTPARIRFVSKAQIFTDAGRTNTPQLELLDSALVRTQVGTRAYTLSILSGPAGAVVTSPNDSAWTFNGIANSRARLRQTGSYRLIASGAGLAPDTSGPITVLASPVAGLSVVSQPQTSSTGSPITAVQVALVDSIGNVANTLSGSFVGNSAVLGIAGQTSGGAPLTLAGRLTQTVVNSVATFDSVIVNAAGTGHRLVFSSTGIAGVTSDSFAVRAPGTPRQLRVTALPQSINGGSRFSPVFRVSVTDSIGTVVPTRTDSITLTLRGPAGAALSGPVRVAAVNGVASFPTTTIPRADSSLRIVATSNQAGITADSTPVFRVNIGPATRLRFVSGPTTQLQNGISSPPFVYAVSDSGGNTIVSATDSVVMFGIGTGVGGRNRRAAVAGLVTFDSVSVGGAAGSNGRVSAFGIARAFSQQDTSPNVAITVGAPARVRYNSGPIGRVMYNWTYFSGVQITDAAGNLVDTASRPVTVSVIGGPAGALLFGNSATASAGVAQFSGLRVATAGTGYRLIFASPGLVSDTTAAFTVIGNPVRAVVLSAPTSGVRNGRLGPVRLAPADSAGRALPFTNVQVSASPSDASVSGTLSQSSAQIAGDSIATVTFNTLRSNTTGPVRLRFVLQSPSSPGMVDSTTVSVSPYSAAQSLAFVTQPGSLVTGSTMSVTPTVAIQDSVGNVVTDSAGRTINVSLATNPGSAFLSGTLSATQAPGSGTVSFPNLSLSAPGNGYSLLASAPGVNAAASQPFNAVTTTDAIALRFVSNTAPTTASAGGVLAGSAGTLAVEVINSTGARVTTSTAPITLAVQGGRAAVTGTSTVTAVAGVATFSAASIQRADTGFVLVASGPTLNTATSPSRLTVNAAAAAGLRVLDSMPTVVAGTTWPAMRVAVVDAFQNVVTSATNSITLRAAQSFPGDSSYLTATGNEALGVSLPLAISASNGIASFTGLRPRRNGGDLYNRFFFDAAGLTSATTPRFVVVPGVAARMYVGSDSSSAARFVNNQPLGAFVWITDSLANCTASLPTTVALGVSRSNGTAAPAGVALSGSATLPTTGCFTRIDGRVFTGVTASDSLRITLSAPGVAVDPGTRTFPVDPFGAASQLAFQQGPTNTTRNVNMTPAVTVRALDAFGNLVSNLSTGVNGLTGTISLTLPNATTVGGATAALVGGAPANLVNGVATFPALQVNNAGTGYQLRATVTSGTTVPGVSAVVNSILFNIL
jgi:hypothetical protein